MTAKDKKNKQYVGTRAEYTLPVVQGHRTWAIAFSSLLYMTKLSWSGVKRTYSQWTQWGLHLSYLVWKWMLPRWTCPSLQHLCPFLDERFQESLLLPSLCQITKFMRSGGCSPKRSSVLIHTTMPVDRSLDKQYSFMFPWGPRVPGFYKT